MRTLSPARLYSLRATMRASRWPLPGLPPRVSHPDTVAALAMVRDELSMASVEREIAVSYSLIDYSDTPSHGRGY